MSTLGPLDSLGTHRFVGQVYESVVLAFDIEVSLVQVIEHEFCSNALEVGVDIEGWHRGALLFVKLGRHRGDIVLAIFPPLSRAFKTMRHVGGAVAISQSRGVLWPSLKCLDFVPCCGVQFCDRRGRNLSIRGGFTFERGAFYF